MIVTRFNDKEYYLNGVKLILKSVPMVIDSDVLSKGDINLNPHIDNESESYTLFFKKGDFIGGILYISINKSDGNVKVYKIIDVEKPPIILNSKHMSNADEYKICSFCNHIVYKDYPTLKHCCSSGLGIFDLLTYRICTEMFKRSFIDFVRRI